MKHLERLQDFQLNEVTITDAYFQNALAKEMAYLKQYDADRLVAGFRETRGLKMRAPKYPGWESTQIRGHILGHYLTAAAQGYASTGDAEILEKLNYIINELAESQAESGYLSAFEEQLFDNVENKQPCWVPWYTMDKIIAGLTACYKLAGSEKALQVVSKLGDWVYDRTSKWSEETHATVLAVEYGGMNEAMYDLYMVTGKPEHADAAHKFDELTLFTPVHDHHDILNGKHANTTIPKFLGGLYRYMALDKEGSEDFYLEAAEHFWDMVVENHTYVTGGNSEWEHFGEPRILDGERTNCNCETCNTYNMLKLSRELFKITRDKKYADFYENTFLNAIMSSQNPETGMTMYFQPMATGYFKVYSTPFDSFWCCTGTGMENFTKCNDSLYFHTKDTLFVNQFISSKVDWKEAGVQLEQVSDIPNGDTAMFRISKANDGAFTVALRVPDWAAGECSIALNGRIVQCEEAGGTDKAGADGTGNTAPEVLEQDGFLYITKVWEEGDTLEYTIPMKVTAHPLHDNANVIGFKYGPLVLSAGLGTEDMEESKTGVDVTIATKNIAIKDFVTIPDGKVEEWIANADKNVRKDVDKLEFSLDGTDSGHLIFTPHYRQHTQRYGIYWNMVAKDSEALQKHILAGKEKARRERVAIDSIPLGNDQYELLHNIQGENTGAGTYNGLQLRHAWKDGWFAYDMKVQPGVPNYLLVKYFSGNAGREFNIYIDEVLYLEETIENVNPGNFYDKYYPIPAKAVSAAVAEGRDTIRVKFATRGDSWVGGLFDQLCIVQDYSRNAGLTACEVVGGELSQAFDPTVTEYTITMNGEQISLKLTPMDESGLVYVNGVLIDDAEPRTLKQSGEVKVVVTAEDFETQKTYLFYAK